jgi:hypothetical protein
LNADNDAAARGESGDGNSDMSERKRYLLPKLSQNVWLAIIE